MTTRLRTISPGTVAVLAVGLALVGWALLLQPAFFRIDDYIYLGEIDVRSPSLGTWLDSIYYRHWAPGHRYAFWLMDGATVRSWYGVVVFQLAVLGVGLLAYHRTLQLLFGRSFWLLIPVVVLACSPRLAFPLIWPSAGLQVVPAMTSATVSVYAFVRWQRDEGRALRWPLLAAAAMAFGLAFYIRPMLVIVWLVALRVLVFCPSLRPAAVARDLWRERTGWLVLLLIPVAYTGHYLTLDAFGESKPFTALAFEQALRLGWLRNVGPSLLGLRVGPGDLSTGQALVELLSQLGFVAALAWSLARHRVAALRGWALLVVFLVGTFVLTASGRLNDLGPNIGLDSRYTADLFWLVPLAVLVALAPQRARTGVDPAPPSTPRSPQSPLLAVGAVAALAVIVALSWASSLDEREGWGGVPARDAAMRIRDDARTIARTTGRPAAVRGGYAPEILIPVAFGFYSEQGRVLPTLRAPLQVNPPQGPNAILTADLHVVPGRAVPGPTVPITRPCLARGSSTVDVPAPAPVARSGGVTVTVVYRGTPPANGLDVSVNSGYGWPPTPQRTIVAATPEGTATTDTGETKVVGVRLALRARDRACLHEVRFGGLEPAATAR